MRKKERFYIYSAMMAALVLLTTAFLPFPTSAGYLHIGDTMIYVAAALLPAPYAVCAGAIGASLADALGGYMIYVPFTLVIKGLMALCLTAKKPKVLCVRNILGTLAAGAVNVAGYFVAALLLYRQGTTAATFAVALETVPGNLVQSAASTLLFVVCAAALDRLKSKEWIDRA